MFWPELMSNHYLSTWCSQRPEDDIRYLETGVPDVVSFHVGPRNRTFVFRKRILCLQLLAKPPLQIL